MELKESLANLTAHALKQFSAKFAADLGRPVTKTQWISAIADFIQNHKRAFVDVLTEPEKLLLAELVWKKERPSPAVFAARYGCKLPKRQEYCGINENVSPVWLLISSYDGQGLTITEDTIEAFRKLVPQPPSHQVQVLENLPETTAENLPVKIFSGESTAQLEARRVLAAINQGKFKVTSQKRPTEATVRLVQSLLLQPDLELELAEHPRNPRLTPDPAGPVRAHAWPVVVQQMGWATVRTGTLKLTASGRAWLAEPAIEGFRQAFDKLRSDDDFQELNRIPHLSGQNGKAKRFINPPGEFREVILKMLESCPVAQWISFEKFFRFVMATGELPEVTTGNSTMLYLGSSQYGHIDSDDDLKSPLARVMVMETLAAVGLVDLAYTTPHYQWPDLKDNWAAESFDFLGRYDGLLALRLNPWGAYLLEVATTYEPPASSTTAKGRLKVLPNLELVLPDQAGGLLGDLLPLVAVAVSDHVWRLDTETVLRSVTQGTKLEELRRILADHADGPLPPSVQDWWQQIESKAAACLAVEPAWMLTWRDETEALTLANTSGLQRLCRHVGGRHLVVTKKNWPAFLREVNRHGYHVPQP